MNIYNIIGWVLAGIGAVSFFGTLIHLAGVWITVISTCTAIGIISFMSFVGYLIEK